MQANGRFQRWNSKGSQQGLVEAAATDLKHFRLFRGLDSKNRPPSTSRQWFIYKVEAGSQL